VPPPAAAPAELLAALSAVLAGLGARWYVFGAQAAIIWGRPRLTADVDVTVRLDPEDPQELVHALETAGFRLRVAEAEGFVRRTRVLPFVHSTTGLPVDIVLAGPGLEEAFLSRAVIVEIAGARIPVVSAEDLIAMKILAGRAKDIDDVRGVLQERMDRLDLDTIRSTLALLEDALGQSDLRPLFDRELARQQRAISGGSVS
jgi:hypothetical protein